MAKGPSRSTQHSPPGRMLAVLVLLVALLIGGVALSARGAGSWVPKLGLDLEGGSSITLTPKTGDVKAAKVTSDNITTAIGILRNRVDARGVAEAEITSQGSGNGRSIVVSLPGKQDKALLQSLLTTAELRFRQVLLEGRGVAVTPAPSTGATPGASAPAVTPSAASSVGASPSATSQGRVAPGALSAATTAASTAPKPSSAASAPAPAPSAAASPAVSAAGGDINIAEAGALQKLFDSYVCDGTQKAPVNDTPERAIVTCGATGSSDEGTKYPLTKAEVVGKDVDTAAATLERNAQGVSTTGRWEIDLQFNNSGKGKWASLTKRVQPLKSPTNQVAVVLDGQVLIAPQIISPIPDGKAQITGSFTKKEASQIAQQLKFGALPLTFDQGPLESISPTLGSDQLRGGLIAGAIGLLLVVLYLLGYYRGLGLVAFASLLVSASLTYLVVALFSNQVGLRLSLASVAGLIVAIGITADSFVVFFERLRDEVREGRSLRVAVETGWRRARRTILVADFVSFLAAAVLYVLSVGSVKGFAFTLGLTTIIDVVVVFLFTKPVMTIAAGTKFFGQGHRLSGLDAGHMGRTPSGGPGASTSPTARLRPTGPSLTKEA